MSTAVEKSRVRGLLKSEFEHRENINEFFTAAGFRFYYKTNETIYEMLNQCRIEYNLQEAFWEPLFFFNCLYDQIDIMLAHVFEPLTVLEHLRNLELNQLQLVFLFSALREFHVFDIVPNRPITTCEEEKIKHAVVVCTKLIEKEYEKMCDSILVNESDKRRYAFSFEKLEPILEMLSTYEEKINYLFEQINSYEQAFVEAPEKYLDDSSRFVQKCYLKIKHYKKLKAESGMVVLQKPRSKQVINREPKFEELFRDSDKAIKLVKALQIQGHLDQNERWMSAHPHVVRLYTVLLQQDIIRKTHMTKLGRIFCRRFMIPEGSFSERTARTVNIDAVYDEFVNLVKSI